MKQVESSMKDWIRSIEPNALYKDRVLKFYQPLFVVLGCLFTGEELNASFEKVILRTGRDAFDPDDEDQTALLESEILDLAGRAGFTLTELLSFEWEDNQRRGNASLLIAQIANQSLIVTYDLGTIPSFQAIALSKGIDLIQWLCLDPELKLPRLANHATNLRHIAVRSPLPWSFEDFAEVAKALIGVRPSEVEVLRTDLLANSGVVPVEGVHQNKFIQIIHFCETKSPKRKA